MKLSESHVSTLRNALEISKVLGIESVLLSAGKISGLKPTLDTAIISDLDIGLPSDISLGIGRVNNLLDRLNSFPNSTATLTVNQRNEVSDFTIVAPRVKMGYRCTSSAMIQAPKENNDPAIAEVFLTVEEVKTLAKSTNVLGSELILFQMNRDGTIRVEASDETNDRFEMVLENLGTVVGETDSFVFNYLAKLLSKIITTTNSEKGITLVFGEGGSITTTIRGHNVIVFAQQQDDYDED